MQAVEEFQNWLMRGATAALLIVVGWMALLLKRAQDDRIHTVEKQASIDRKAAQDSFTALMEKMAEENQETRREHREALALLSERFQELTAVLAATQIDMAKNYVTHEDLKDHYRTCQYGRRASDRMGLEGG